MITASTPTHREINSSGVLAWTDREDVVNRITQFPRPENGPLEIASETVQTTNSEARWTEMMNGREELVELVRLFLDVLVLLFLYLVMVVSSPSDGLRCSVAGYQEVEQAMNFISGPLISAEKRSDNSAYRMSAWN